MRARTKTGLQRAFRARRYRPFKTAILVALAVAGLLQLASGPSASLPLTVDRVTTAKISKSAAVFSAAFSTSGKKELVVAFILADGPATATQSVTALSGAGLSWSRAAQAHVQPGDAEIWSAWSGSKVSNVKLSATLASGPYQGLVTVVSFIGAASHLGVVATAGGPAGAPSATVAATSANSYLYGAALDWSSAAVPVLSIGQSPVSSFVDTGARKTFWTQSQTAASSSVGAPMVIADTAPLSDSWNMATAEIMPASSTSTSTTTTTAASTTTSSTTTSTTTEPATTTTSIESTTTTAEPTTTTTTVVSGPQPVGVTGNFSLSFDDEFDGTSLDRSRWYPNRWFAAVCAPGANGNELEYYTSRPSNVNVAGGLLHLVAQQEQYTCTESTWKGRSSYTSGWVETGGSRASDGSSAPPGFTCTAGCFVEASIKEPPGAILFPAVWMLPYAGSGDYPSLPEIDNVEFYWTWTEWEHHIHLSCNPGMGYQYSGPDATDGFHTIGLWWQPNEIDYFVDGVKTWSYTGCGIPSGATQMYVILNLAIGGAAPNPPPSEPFPKEMQVDYVRAWTSS